MPHIGIGRDGGLGVVKRKGQPFESHSCGALCKFAEELRQGRVDLKMDERDLEMCYLRMWVLRKIGLKQGIDLMELTRATHSIMLEELEAILSEVVDTKKADYAVFSGIQINGPETNYIAPLSSYLVIDGQKKEIHF
jgi:hypothetical protein